MCLKDFDSVTVGAATVFHGSNLDVLPFMADNSVDSIVTDPPYELGFMGKSWDSSGIAYNVDLWRECLRVLKPGGHLLAFGGTRTWHRVAVAIEDAGFDVRDSIAWLYGSGFPKSHDISKGIDKAAGAEREVIGTKKLSGNAAQSIKEKGGTYASNTNSIGVEAINVSITAPATDDAKKWAGWGTALKPAFEPVVVARKPLVGTVAENVLAWGVGGLNIDASRIGTDSITINTFDNGAKPFGDAVGEPYSSRQIQGRWPANIILDEYTAGLLDEQSGERKGMASQRNSPNTKIYGGNSLNDSATTFPEFREGYNDTGGASRFFYVSKANKRDRNEGNVLNTHPTVKPTDLMRYLIKLVTPAGGIVLDPFAGSGSTGKAALLDGYQFIGIELTADYLPIIEERLRWADQEHKNQASAAETEKKETLF
jgi:site-specific DNA-methyltransferase (adenine-specific)